MLSRQAVRSVAHGIGVTAVLALLSFATTGAVAAVGEKVRTQAIPPMQGSLPRLTGTAWKVTAIYNRGEKPKRYSVVQTMIFCKSGRWELFINPSVAQIGKYSIAGSELTTHADGTVGRFNMAWDAQENQLNLDEKGIVMRLEYTGEAKC